MGENCSIIFTCCGVTVSSDNFKPVQVILHMTIKEFFRSPILKMENGLFNLESYFEPTSAFQLQCTAEFVSKASKDFFLF